MDYTNTFLELVTNKEKLFQNHSIVVSLGEIADIWNRKNLVLEVKNIPPAFGKAEYIDHAFLEDVILVLANLQKENLVVFVGCDTPISNPINSIIQAAAEKKVDTKDPLCKIYFLTSLADAIFVKMGSVRKMPKDENISVNWFDPESSSIFFGKDKYKPSFQPQAKVVKLLFSLRQEQDSTGRIIKSGERILEKNMENELELKPGRVRAIKKQLDRCFNEKNFPLKIDFNTEGLMLIYTRS